MELQREAGLEARNWSYSNETSSLHFYLVLGTVFLVHTVGRAQHAWGNSESF